MTYKRLFVDSDILLDMLLSRNPHIVYTQIFLAESKKRNFILNTSTLVIANINYILAKKIGAIAAKENIKGLIKIVNVLPFETDIIDLALSSNIVYFEDAIQSFIAERYKCEAIITRNIKDYKESTLPVLTAEQFLMTL